MASGFVVYYSPRYAMRHACQFELVHAYLADDKEGGPGRLMVINPENNRAHIAPVPDRHGESAGFVFLAPVDDANAFPSKCPHCGADWAGCNGDTLRGGRNLSAAGSLVCVVH